MARCSLTSNDPSHFDGPGDHWLRCSRRLPVHLAHAFEDEVGVVGHVVGAAVEGGWEDGG